MGRPAKFEQDELLKRATRLFWSKGSDALSTRDLEEGLDLRAPAIYRRFPSKNDLLARCIDYYVDNVIVFRVRRYLEAADDPLKGLHDFFTSTLQPYDCKPRVRGCLLASTAAHANGQVPEVRAAIFRGWRLIDTAFQQQILRAQRAGQIDPDLDPGALSQALIMSLEGLLTIIRAGDTDLRPGIDMIFRLLGGRLMTP
ncbi:MAG: TetR/AcrR family transcriptional regulator [Pseudohaliea sp.]